MKRNEMTEEQRKRNDYFLELAEKHVDSVMNLYAKQGGLTDYQLLMARSQNCENKALILNNAEEKSLAQFYKNAAIGFEMKAKKLPVVGVKNGF